MKMIFINLYHIFIFIVAESFVYSSLDELSTNDIILKETRMYNERTLPKQIKHQKYNTMLANYTTLLETDRIELSLKHKRERRNSIRKKCVGLCKRSLCPWTEIWDIDNNRNPVFIPKAICDSNCHFNFTATISSKILKVVTVCVPLKRDIPIFKDNKYTYIKDWPIACVCTKKRISRVPRVHTKGGHDKKRKEIKKHVHMGKQRRRKRLKEKKQRNLNKSDRYSSFKIIPPVLRPFQFLPQYKK